MFNLYREFTLSTRDIASFERDGIELDHIKTMVTDGIYKAPILKEGGVLIAPGSQFADMVLGQDMKVGFIGPTAKEMEFYVTESLVPRIRVPQSICALEG